MRWRLTGPALACAAGLAASTAWATQEPPKVVLKPPEPAPAEPAAPTAVAPVAVTATLSPTELRTASLSFVRSHAATSARLDQIPRWAEPICAHVSGVTREHADQIRERIAAAARAAGQRFARDGCSANVAIYFSDDPQGLVDGLAAQNEMILGYYHRADFNRLKTVTRPIQAWYMTATAGSGGPAAGSLFASVGRSRFESEDVDDPDSPAPNGCGDSRFSGCLQSVFKNILVVVDWRRVSDPSPDAVADYVAMLVLSQPSSLDRCNALPSVIDLFADCPGRAPPEGLTRADRAYLAALYKADPEARKGAQQSQIAGAMAQALIRR